MGDSIELVWGNLELNKKGGKTLKGDWCIQYWNVQINKIFKKDYNLLLKTKGWYYLYKTDR